MNLPPFVYVKAFWEALSYILAGVLALLVVFGVLPPQYALGSAVILSAFLGILKWFDIEPQLMARAAKLALKAKAKK